MLADRLQPILPARRPASVPKHLSGPGRRLWRAVLDRHPIVEPHRLTVLASACECLDRIEAAQGEIAEYGLTVDGGRYGRKVNPAVNVERDQKRLLLAALLALDLDLSATSLVTAGSRR